MKLISDLMTYCTTEGIRLYLGDEYYQNAIADGVTYQDNELIMLAGFTVKPVIVNSRVQSETYSGVIALGRKREYKEVDEDVYEKTESSLDETFEQKYVRRLKDLYDLLVMHLADFACENEVSIVDVTMRTQINTFDLNADFVACEITLAYE